MKPIQSVTEKNNLIAILAGCSLFLSLIEFTIPKPLPFMRIGLANIPVMISLVILSPRQTFFLMFIKVLGQSLVSGTLFSYIFLFSIAGSFSSCSAMLFVKHMFRSKVSMVGISAAGAFISNSVQVLMACIFIFEKSAVVIAPPFLATGLVTSVLLGLFTEYFINHSEWLKGKVRT